MLVGSTQVPVQQFIVGVLIVAFLLLNSFLFKNGHDTYTVKYQLMRQHRFFRVYPLACFLVELLYKISFTAPFILLAVLSLLPILTDPLQVFPLFVNGFIVVLLFYPSKRVYYFWKEVGLWALSIASQIISLFLHDDQSLFYGQLSAIFLTASAMLLSLAVLARETRYWEIDMAIKACDAEIKAAFNKFATPKLFDGGLYGLLCRRPTLTKFLILYLCNLVMLGLNATLIYVADGSLLGVVSLVSNSFYDLFILSFDQLKGEISYTFVLIFIGRLLSFVFGQQLWLFGYCLLYLLVGVFLGRLIINRRLPMKLQTRPIQGSFNAFKTPQFMLFLLTAEIAVLVMSVYFGVSASSSVQFNGKQVQLWEFALIMVILTWVILCYLLTVRTLNRYAHGIKSGMSMYFGIPCFRQHHMYILITYLLIILLGLYCLLIINDEVIFVGCVFLPPIYLVLHMMGDEWTENNYQVLADTDDYNKLVDKRRAMRQKKRAILQKRKESKPSEEQLKGKLKEIVINIIEDNIEDRSNESTNLEMTRMQKEDSSERSNSSEDTTALVNWRNTENTLSLRQFWACLTPSDKRIITGILLLLVLLPALSLASYFYAASFFGLSVSVSLLSYISLVPYYKLFKCVSELLLGELITASLGCVLTIAYWLALSLGNEASIYGLLWAVVYMALAAALLIFCFLKGTGLLSKVSLLIMMGVVLGYILFQLYLLSVIAMGLLVVLLAVGCASLVPLYHKLSYDHIPKYAEVIPIGVGGASVVGCGIYGVLFNVVSNLIVFSLLMGALFVALFLSGVIIWLEKEKKKYTEPLVYSAYGTPVYCFDSPQERLHSSMRHKILFQWANVVLIVYATVISLIFTEKYIAVYSISLYLTLTFFQDILFSMKSYMGIALRKRELSDRLVKDALSEVLHKYMAQQIDSRTAEQISRQIVEMKEEIDKLTDENEIDCRSLDLVMKHDEYLRNVEEEEKFLFFWIVLIQFHMDCAEKERMLRKINQMKEIKTALEGAGIIIETTELPFEFDTKYHLVKEEIHSLNPFDYVTYKEILGQHRKNKQIEQDQLRKNMQEQSNQHAEQQNQIFRNIGDLRDTTPEDQIRKFKRMIKANGKKKFVDDKFRADQTSLGDALKAKVDKWSRPKPGQVLCLDSFSYDDVKQGAIGDCYLISSIGVLGDRWIKRVFGIRPDGTKQWDNVGGAYMVRFNKFLKDVFVVVDDLLPVDQEGEIVFARSEQSQQLWPSILEKAYAKLYSGYQNIVSGKCHRVLAEFTGGFPCQYEIEAHRKNPNGLWSKILSAVANRYLLAAGSLPSSLGDRAESPGGIVQGHAYSVLDAREVEDYKLLKLKNPHGKGGAEWRGDFSDESVQMNKRMINLLGHSQANDGIFWMKYQDFLHEFKYLYLCAVFNEDWKKLGPIKGAFTKQNSFGTPNNDELGKARLNPQYGITTTKKCSLFVNLTQQAQTALKGVNMIYMRVQRNQGKRICKSNLSSALQCGTPIRPTNTVSLSVEYPLEAAYYPCTFTLYLSCDKEGSVGDYTLEMYCNDIQATLILDQVFDRN